MKWWRCHSRLQASAAVRFGRSCAQCADFLCIGLYQKDCCIKNNIEGNNMAASPIDFSRTEKPRQIQENMISYMRLFAGLPGMAMYDAESFWFVCNKSAPGDVILRANWPDDDPEARIDALLERIGQHIDQIGWMVFPGDQPADLGKRLEARGMPGGPGGNWLWADLESLGTGPAVPDNFRIELVRDDPMMVEWTRVSEAGFGGELACFYDAYARHGYRPDAFSLHYIGYLDDTPVTSGTLLDAGGWATIYDISTPDVFRRQGFGGAITHALMHEIRKRGYADTWIWSSNMAKSLYQKLGYVDADFGVREHNWRK
jgi:ribosomal protein S18 acetylase RimI-like enzyme